jgi:hypothetical protein
MAATNVQAFSGDVEIAGALNITGSVTSTVGVDKVNLATDGTDASRSVIFSTGTTGAQPLKTDAGLTYNPNTNKLTVSGGLSTSVTPGSYLTGSAYDGSTARTFAVDATSENTENKVVARDASGDFSAGTITAALTGNADTATALATARDINGVSFDGTGNITVEPYISGDDTGETTNYLVYTKSSTDGYKRLYEDNGLVYDNTNNEILLNSIQIHDYIYHRGDTDTYFGFNADETYRIVTNNAERFRVKSNGAVGIGTNDPIANLHVQGNSGGNPPTSGTGSNGLFRIRDNHNVTFDVGTMGVSPWTVWAQVADGVSMGSEYPLSLQPNGGFVGIKTLNPDAPVHIRAFANTPAGYNNGVRIQTSSNSNRWDMFIWGNTPNLEWAYNNATKCYMTATGSNNVLLNFTGQHRTFIKNIPFTQASELEGLIVSADQNEYIKMCGGIETGSNAITVNESLPIVSMSTKVNDKKCFGVISTSEDSEKREEHYGNFVTIVDKESGDTRVYINSLGEGALWVTNINGSLESGDYITTSNISGYGQKQDSHFLTNYTVAKITMDCNFEPLTQPVKIIKKELANVNYWVSIKYNKVSEKEYIGLDENCKRIITETYFSNENDEITLEEYNALEPGVQTTYTELTRTVYQEIVYEESTTEREGWDQEVRQELVNALDEYKQIQWENDPGGATEKAYKIRYLDINGNITDEANCIYKAAFVGCTYHCG